MTQKAFQCWLPYALPICAIAVLFWRCLYLHHDSWNYIKFHNLISIYSWFIRLLSIGQVNISLIVNDSEAEQCVRALHSTFFEADELKLDAECVSQNGSVSASNAAWAWRSFFVMRKLYFSTVGGRGGKSTSIGIWYYHRNQASRVSFLYWFD